MPNNNNSTTMKTEDLFGWQGPGTRGTQRRAAKDKQQTHNAIHQYQPCGLAAKLLPKNKNVKEQSKILKGMKRLEPYHEGFDVRAAAIAKAAYTPVKEELLEVKRFATAFLKDAEKVMQKEVLFGTGIVPGWLTSVYRALAQVQYLLGTINVDMEAKLFGCSDGCDPKLLMECIKDATNGSTLYAYLNDDDPSVTTEGIIFCLMIRGKALRALNQLEAAETDFRAVCAKMRATAWNRQPSIHEATDFVLRCLAEQKLRDKTPRPHYTKEERVQLERELGLGIYSSYLYKCANCHKERTACSSVKLSLCSKCKQRWFCSNECIREAWHSFHKHDCKQLRANAGVSSYMMPEDGLKGTYELIRKYGYTAFGGVDMKTDTAAYVMWDAERKECFSSITDGVIHALEMPDDDDDNDGPLVTYDYPY